MEEVFISTYNCNINASIDIYGGYNSIFGNSGYNVEVAHDCNVTARYSWWGSYPPDTNEFSADSTSSIDCSYALDYDPNGVLLKRSQKNNITGLSNTFFDFELQQALQNEMKKEI